MAAVGVATVAEVTLSVPTVAYLRSLTEGFLVPFKFLLS